MKFFYILTILLLASCSFDSKDAQETQDKKPEETQSASDGEDQVNDGEDQVTDTPPQTDETDVSASPSVEELKNRDTSGDQISDYQKMKLGLDPFIADIPKLRLRFLQNFKITVHWKSLKNSSKGKFEIDTKVGRDDPDFEYRVGEILVRKHSLKDAARIGKFPLIIGERLKSET